MIKETLAVQCFLTKESKQLKKDPGIKSAGILFL